MTRMQDVTTENAKVGVNILGSSSFVLLSAIKFTKHDRNTTGIFFRCCSHTRNIDDQSAPEGSENMDVPGFRSQTEHLANNYKTKPP